MCHEFRKETVWSILVPQDRNDKIKAPRRGLYFFSGSFGGKAVINRA